MAFDPAGNLYFTDNAIDALPAGSRQPVTPDGEPPQADELNMISAQQLGVGAPINFGFPNCYIQYANGGVLGVPVGTGCVQPTVSWASRPPTTPCTFPISAPEKSIKFRRPPSPSRASVRSRDSRFWPAEYVGGRTGVLPLRTYLGVGKEHCRARDELPYESESLSGENECSTTDCHPPGASHAAPA